MSTRIAGFPLVPDRPEQGLNQKSIWFTLSDALLSVILSSSPSVQDQLSFVLSSRRLLEDRRRRLRSVFGAFADLNCFRNCFEAHVGRRYLLLACVNHLAKTKQGAGYRYVFHIWKKKKKNNEKGWGNTENSDENPTLEERGTSSTIEELALRFPKEISVFRRSMLDAHVSD
jgi:hypothetical protein